MDISRLPISIKLGLFLLSIAVLHRTFAKLSLWRRRRAFQLQKGTMPMARVPQRDPIFGIDMFLKSIRASKEHKLLDYFAWRFQVTGANTVQMNLRGRQVYTTIEPENIKYMQAVDFKKWGLPTRRKVGFHRLLGKGIFTTDGDEWQHSREMLRPNFVRAQIGDVDMFEKHVRHVIAAVPRDGSTVNLADLFFKLTMDSATELLFGESTDSLSKGSSEGFSAAFTQSQEHTLGRARWGAIAKYISRSATFERDVEFVHGFVDYYVQRALARRHELLASASKQQGQSTGGGGGGGAERYVFIDELVRQTDDPVRIRSELLNILLAGRDTTASLLTNVWWQLARRPDVWRKLQAEVAQLRGARPGFERLKELKFLRGVLHESLRLHPVVPANAREAVEDTTLPLGGGPDGRAPIFVAKGQRMQWSVYAMHRRRDLFGPDADEFRPERWIDDPAANGGAGARGLRPGWEYLPFNGGARVCLGQQYALTEAGYTTVRLCQIFSEIESRDSNPWTEFITLTCVNLHGAKVALTARE